MNQGRGIYQDLCSGRVRSVVSLKFQIRQNWQHVFRNQSNMRVRTRFMTLGLLLCGLLFWSLLTRIILMSAI